MHVTLSEVLLPMAMNASSDLPASAPFLISACQLSAHYTRLHCTQPSQPQASLKMTL
jgi:hypothetical protein